MFMLFPSQETQCLLSPRRGITEGKEKLARCFHSYPSRKIEPGIEIGLNLTAFSIFCPLNY